MIYFDLVGLLHIARWAIGASAKARHVGLLEVAATRPQTSALGTRVHATIHEKQAHWRTCSCVTARW